MACAAKETDLKKPIVALVIMMIVFVAGAWFGEKVMPYNFSWQTLAEVGLAEAGKVVCIVVGGAAVLFVGVCVLFLMFACFRSTREVKRTTELHTERCSDGSRKLLKPLTVIVEGKKNKKGKKIEKDEEITVPVGFVTDYSSIPWGARWVMHWSKVDVAGVVHDWLYAKAYNSKLTRRQTDMIWQDIARSGEHKANRFQAAAGWLGLRIGGGCTWRCYRRDPIVQR